MTAAIIAIFRHVIVRYACIIMLALCPLLYAGSANAAYDYAKNDSCLGLIPLGDRAISALLTIGTGEAISEGFSIDDEECTTNNHTNTIRFCYNPWLIPGALRFHKHNKGGIGNAFSHNKRCWDGGPYHTMKPGQTKYIDGVFFQVNYIADAICVQFLSLGSWRTIGCKYRADPAPASTPETACFISDSCSNTALRESRSFFSVTGSLVQCISETLDKIFQDTNNCEMAGATGSNRNLNSSATTRTNMFIIFQQSMRKAVSAALTLYVIFFFMRVIIGDQAPQKGEIFIFMLKMILVSYFALGDGLHEFLFPALRNASAELAGIMFQAGGARGLCEFNPVNYNDPTMALWDSLDCRIGYYLGINTVGVAPFLLILPVVLLPLFFLNIVFIVFLLAFVVFLLSIAIYAVQSYILCIIFMTLVLYLGPLFIPMALFKKTRPYFDGWVKLLLSFAIQPAVLFAFLALILTIFDNAIYPGCEFSQKNITVPWEPGKLYPFYYIDTSHLTPSDKEACMESFAYQVDLLSKGKAVQVIDAIFITFTIINTDTLNDLFMAMVRLVLFGFIAAHFLEILSGFAAELTGGQTIKDISTSPFNVANLIKDKVSGAAGKGQKPDPAAQVDAGDGTDGE